MTDTISVQIENVPMPIDICEMEYPDVLIYPSCYPYYLEQKV